MIWTAYKPEVLPQKAAALIADELDKVFFSAASIWKVAIKSRQNRPDFQVHADALRINLLARDFNEIAITSRHGCATTALPLIHKDPFDRILIAQATIEDITLLTFDTLVARYPGPIQPV